jgi:hypothetical protein
MKGGGLINFSALAGDIAAMLAAAPAKRSDLIEWPNNALHAIPICFDSQEVPWVWQANLIKGLLPVAAAAGLAGK